MIHAPLVLAVVIFVLTYDINSWKPGVEAAASGAMRMDVHLNGEMKLKLFPRPGVSLEDIVIQNRGADVASSER